MVKENVTKKEDWRNNGNNESQVKVECLEQGSVCPKDLNNINRIANLRNHHQEQMVLVGNKLRVPDQTPVEMIEHCRAIDVFNEYLRNIEILGKDRRSERYIQKQELPKQGFFKFLQSVELFQIDAIQVPFDTKIMDGISETHRIPRKQKGIQDSLIANKETIVQMSKFHDKHHIMIKKDSGHQMYSETIEDTSSDISAVEDRLNALVDGIEPRTSFLLPVKKVSHSSLPSHKQLYKLQPERQSDAILHRRNLKTISTHQQECPLSSTDDELNIFRGTKLCVIGMPNHQYHLETTKQLAVLRTSCTCDRNSVNLNKAKKNQV